MLAYILAALVWWFIELNRQNDEMTNLWMKTNPADARVISEIMDIQSRKQAQYLGEGITFLLLIIVAALLFFRAIRRRFQLSLQQQQFMMAVTHELKTPIAVAQLNLETIQKRKLEETQKEKLLQNTSEEINRMNNLCNNMLLSSQMEAGGYKMIKVKIDLSEIAEKAVTDFKKRFPLRKIDLEMESNCLVEGDEMLLEILIHNLIENAHKYSPKEELIQLSLGEEKKNYCLKVADRGAGIDDSDKEKIFEKYYRTGDAATKKAKGTGLGLYLARRIALAHQGNLTVKDQIPKGSVFCFSMPKSYHS
jgi:signal transduction histidine kinase